MVYLALAVAAGGAANAQLAPQASVVVNECASGPNGWIELYNRSSERVDLAKDPDACWFIDDAAGGGGAKLVSDANVNHAPGSTSCSSLERTPTCAALGPGESVWIRYPFINATTPDACPRHNAERAMPRGAACETGLWRLLKGASNPQRMQRQECLYNLAPQPRLVSSQTFEHPVVQIGKA